MTNADANSSIQAIAGAIREHHRQAQGHAVSAVEHAISAGLLLIQAKANVPHGGWLPWIEANCEFSRWTAANYIRLAERRTELANGERAPHFSLRSALAALAEAEPTEADVRTWVHALLDAMLRGDDDADLPQWQFATYPLASAA